METYDSVILLMSFAGIFAGIVGGIVHALYKRTLKYIGLFLCVAGFCFCTVFTHMIVSLAYGDPSDPNYETYKDWNLYRYLLSDIRCLIIWLGIAVLNYFAFVKRNRVVRLVFILGAGAVLMIFALLCVLGAITT